MMQRPEIIILAATPPRELTPREKNDVLYWGAGLILFLLLGGSAIMLLRKRLNSAKPGAMDEYSKTVGGFTLADLKKMREQDQLTEAEYQAAKTKLLARHKSPEV